jgi:NADH dehydrogenase
VRVILADRGPTIAGRLGGGQPVIERACRELGIELMTNFALSSVDSEGALLTDGTRLPAATVIWCAGMQANELTECIDADRDTQGRLKVDDCMRVIGSDNVFAAGDVAHALIDGERPSVMSCQHARPMGRFAGHNAVNELFGLPLEPLNIDWYTNIIDLGPWGAVYTQGWSRVAVAQGMEAKNTKSLINRERIYPPRSGTREQILAAAALDLQRPPQL